MDENQIIRLAKAAISIQSQAVNQLHERIDENFVRACKIISGCRGRVVVIGMGKSGHIGGKIAATFASTGTPAFFVHPGEASHGDLGMITEDDVVLALSNSGETTEILTILPIIQRLNVPLIAVTGNTASSLAKSADVALDVSVEKEACPLGLAPTTSTTASLVMGDALAVSLLESRGFTKQDFALSHPAGSLGRKLLLKVGDIMHSGNNLPAVKSGTLLTHALEEMSTKKLGMVAVIGEGYELLGVFTDGDLRRTLDKFDSVKNIKIDELMTKNCITIGRDQLAESALQLMEQHNINGLLVIDDEQKLIGALNMLDLLHARVL